MRKNPNPVDEQLKKNIQGLKDYVTGRGKLKTWILSPTGERTMFYESLPESRAREARVAALKATRAKLGLTQLQMAAALRVSVNTLKGWEAGKPIPEVAFTLAEVLRDFPAVRKRLMAA
jgi:DNA-binding transcriptional regulator YiaG